MDNYADGAALKSLYDTYIKAWNERDLDTYCSLFAFPVVIGGAGRDPDVVPDYAAWRARTDGNLEALAGRGWATSTIDKLYVAPMAADTGLITVTYTRVAKDGSKIEGGTSNYLARKLDGEWKIVGMIAP